ncbi:MAG: Fe-S cluster assembly protein HesB [Acidimicrobiales bacterium]|nr:Fe-S cluster assembly protein HesB [Acidimicrobiales bacterium]
MPTLHLSQDPRADQLLAESPLALLIGMVLDQQVPLERAFSAPSDLKDRLGGTLDASSLAAMDPERLVDLFRERPALHRFPGSMAKRTQELCRVLVEEYGGDAAAVWSGVADGAELLARVRALPGFGEQKAKIFVALLGKQFGVRPEGWRTVSAPFGEEGSFRSVADIDSPAALATVRQAKKEAKAAAAAAPPATKAPAARAKAPKPKQKPKSKSKKAAASPRG